MISPDGRAIVAVLEFARPRLGRRGVNVSQELVKFSAATGKRIAILTRLPRYGLYESALWMSNSGHALIVAGGVLSAAADVVTGQRAVPIPWSRNIAAAAW